jgi:hypothetical protein
VQAEQRCLSRTVDPIQMTPTIDVERRRRYYARELKRNRAVYHRDKPAAPKTREPLKTPCTLAEARAWVERRAKQRDEKCSPSPPSPASDCLQ